MSLRIDKEGQILEKALERFLSYDRLIELSRSTGFIERLRKIHPVIFLHFFLFTACLHKHPTVAEIWRTYTDLTESDISYSSFVGRIGDASLRFFQDVLEECIMSPVSGMSLELRERYRKFATVFIQDSTIVRLHKKLADRFPASRSRKIAAGIKVSYLLNVLANGPRSISIVPERTAEIKTIHVGPWVKDSLLLIDLGFYSYQLFSRIGKEGGYFISRMKKESRLTIKSFHSPVTDAQKEMFTGKDLKHILKILGGTSVDITVAVRIKHTNESGKERREPYLLRCVGRIHPETGKWHLYLTNLSTTEYSVDEIATLYGFRWEIESLFDETKNECTLGDIRVERDGAVLTLLYAALIRQLVLKRVYLVMRSLMSEEERERLSLDLYGRAFIEQMGTLLEILIDCWKEESSQTVGVKGWQKLFNRLSRNARQYHAARLTRDRVVYR